MAVHVDFPASLFPAHFKSNMVDCTLRCLTSTAAGMLMVDEIAALLTSQQAGYVVKNGAEAAVHAASLYLKSLDPSSALDFSY